MDITTSSLVNNSINTTFSDITPILPQVPISQQIEDNLNPFFNGFLIFLGSTDGIFILYHCAIYVKSSCFCSDDDKTYDLELEQRIYSERQKNKQRRQWCNLRNYYAKKYDTMGQILLLGSLWGKI